MSETDLRRGYFENGRTLFCFEFPGSGLATCLADHSVAAAEHRLRDWPTDES